MNQNKLIIIIAIIITIVIIIWVVWREIKSDEMFPDPEPTSKTIFGNNIQILKLPQIRNITEPEKLNQKFRSFNPSIIKLNDDILYACRLSNATNCRSHNNVNDSNIQDSKISEKILVEGGTAHIWSFITLARGPRKSILDVKNHKLTIYQKLLKAFQSNSSDNDLMESNLINSQVPISVKNVGKVGCAKGMEDPRIIVSSDQNNLHIIANSLSGENCKNEMWLMTIPIKQLNQKFIENTIERNAIENYDYSLTVNPIKLTIDFDLDKKQKNWMPFFHENKLMFIYNVNPHTILECDTNTGQCIQKYQTYNPQLPNNIRGGSCAIKLTGVNLPTLLHHEPVQIKKSLIVNSKSTIARNHIKSKGVIHHPSDFYVVASHVQRASHRYVTQFYAFESKPPFKIIAMSDDFVFDEDKDITRPTIQFASGLEQVDDFIIVTFGEDDCDSKICKIPLSDFIKALKPLKPIENPEVVD